MAESFLGNLDFALGITAPIFVLVVLGIILKRLRLVDQGFVSSASWLVFAVGLPTLLFVNILQTGVEELVNPRLVLVGLAATVVGVALFWVVAVVSIDNRAERGIFVQGAFRGNLGVVGLAFCINAYGAVGLATASLYMAALTVLYNILAVLVLARTLGSGGERRPARVLLQVARNPIIIAIVLALAFASLGIELHPALMQAGQYIADMALPLALLCIGASISLKELRQASALPLAAVTGKLLVVPAISLALAVPFGFSDMELGVLFLMSAAPTATASYIMVQAMGGKGPMAANIVVLSTLLSVVTVSAGIVLLRGLGWI